ncbi:MAG: type II secretion system protein GspE, partial [Burkholderia sp.]|nr:type II secretion system protein GspE [Burkholderia sp.]
MSTPSMPPSASTSPASSRAAEIASAAMTEQADHAERAAPSAIAARLVPYGFARSGQILVAHQHADSLEVWISERTSEAALAEVARNFGAVSV